MEKEFVPYELAVKLKSLGFDEPCLKTMLDFDITYESDVKMPLYQQAFRFFREKYDWQHSIDPTADQHSHKLGYNYWIWNYKTGEEHYTMPKNRPTIEYKRSKIFDMKTHLIKRELKTGERITHFKTFCGITRHTFTNLPNTTDETKVTCKMCLKKQI